MPAGSNNGLPFQSVRERDLGTIDPRDSFGAPNFAATDHVEVQINGAALATGQRQVLLAADNDDATVTRVHVAVSGKGNGLLILPKMTTAQRPTAVAALNGGVYYDTTDNKVYVCANGAWAVIGTQT